MFHLLPLRFPDPKRQSSVKKIHFELFLKNTFLCDSYLRKQNNNHAIVSL